MSGLLDFQAVILRSYERTLTGIAPIREERKNGMKKYKVTCRFCGHENCDLFLEETDGWMECEACQTVQQIEYLDLEPEEEPIIIRNAS